MTARLILFGAPAIERGAASVVLPFERRSQLLAFLGLKRTWVGRAELAALLWPEQDARLAYANLRKTLFRLQSAPWAPEIEAQGGALRLAVETDVAAFERALRETRGSDAVALRRGELLAGFEDDRNESWTSWLGFERERLRNAWRTAVLSRLADEVEPGEGIALSARLLDADPLDEAALRAHMSWLARDGQAARARQAYREFTGRLERDLGLAPPAELKALHESLGSTIASAPLDPPKKAAAPADGFVGRAVELRRIATLLSQGDCRLLTVVGPGGVGKTRLVQRALPQIAPGHPDGALFVPLDDIVSGGGLGGRIARELGVRLQGGKEPLDQITEYLRDRRVLLVLDNFEQLASEASILETLLRAAPELRIVVTSRTRLALSMEWLLPLEGLLCPELEDGDRLEAFDAARLFVQAAQRVEPALVPAVEATSIVEICRQVEGLPLALELAASWTRVLSCEAIATELRRGGELLHAVDTTHPARHASIEVIFDHSWRLLGASERDALSRLSVFRGGFTAEAARAVAGASLPVLGALADKSLLRKEDARIFMHPLVAQLAALRLGDGDLRAATERAHAVYFHRLVAQLTRGIEDGDRDALQWVEIELENCRIAWRWAIAQGGTDALARSATILLYFWDHRGRLEEGLSLLREALHSEAAQADAKFTALLLGAAAHLQYRLDRYPEAEATAARALALAERDRATKMQCLKVLAACSLRRGRHADAKRYYQQALRQAPESTDPHNAAALLDNLALVEKEMGDYDEALRLSIRSLAQHRRLRDAAGEALGLNNLGALYFDRKEFESAGAHLREGLAICDRHGLVSTRGLILANLTEHAIRANDDDAAAAYAHRALDVARTAGNRFVESWLLLQLARLALRRGDPPAARAHLAAALGIAVAVGGPVLQVAGVACFAELLAAQGELECARRVLAFAAKHPATNAAQNAELRAQLAALPPATNADSAWPAIELDELVHRIVVESDLAHVPLIAALRPAR